MKHAPSPFITTTNLSKQYNIKDQTISALASINLTIYHGEKIAIMGASGSGKSTLLHILGGLDSPTSGEVIIDNISLEGLKDEQMSNYRNSKVGFVFQDFNLIEFITVIDNVSLPLRIAGVSKIEAENKALNILNSLKMLDLKNRFPSQLSGGQRQRVTVARAIINKPRLLLADEPTANLDADSANTVLDLLADIQLEGAGVFLIVTHDINIAKRFDRIVYLENGKVMPKNKKS